MFAFRGEADFREQLWDVDLERTFDPLDLCRKRAYSRFENIWDKIGSEATRIHDVGWGGSYVAAGRARAAACRKDLQDRIPVRLVPGANAPFRQSVRRWP